MQRIRYASCSALIHSLCTGIACASILLLGSPASGFFMFFVPPAGSPGDYDGNGTVGPEDYDVWKVAFGSTEDLAADGNGNEVVDAADYTIWRDNLGNSAAPEGNWEDADLWHYDAGSGDVSGQLPGQFDAAVIHARRTATLSTDAGFISELRLGDTATPPGGTLNINTGGKLTTLGEVLMGTSNPGDYKEGVLNLNGGSLTSFGAFFLAFEPDAHHTVNIGPGSLLDVNQNLIARFGTATFNQTGGIVDIQNNLIWGEGGDDDGLGDYNFTRAEYNLSGGELKIGQALAIGRSVDQDRPESDGRVNISGGTLTASDLIFSEYEEEESILSISGSGIVRIAALNYTEADALLDIENGFIVGSMLEVSSLSIAGIDFTQITSGASGFGGVAVPEPSAAVLILGPILAAFARQRQLRLPTRTTRS